MTSKKAIRTGTYIAYAVMFGLFMLSLNFITRAVIAYMSPESLWTDYKTPLIAANAAQTSSGQNINLSFDPFHRSTASLPEETGEDAPETTLNLKLLGRRAGPEGTAILQTPDNKQNVFSVGEEVISGVTLKSVTPEYIVLSLDGRLERLTFLRDTNSAFIAAPQDTQPSPPAQINTFTAKGFTASDFMSSVSVERVNEGGKIKGFRIKTRNSQYDLTAYGLQNGDIITKIGNVDLTTGQPNFQTLMSAINASQSLSMSLIRNGNAMTITVK